MSCLNSVQELSRFIRQVKQGGRACGFTGEEGGAVERGVEVDKGGRSEEDCGGEGRGSGGDEGREWWREEGKEVKHRWGGMHLLFH